MPRTRADLPRPSRPTRQWRLREYCHQLGWTQIQVAVRAGVSRETIRKLERGEWQTAYVGTIVRVAHSLGASVVDLVPALAERPARGGRGRGV